MVNFTEKLDANVRAEWANHYIDYRVLKKAMKGKAVAPPTPDICSSSTLKQPLLSQAGKGDQAAQHFNIVLVSERDKVQRFYADELQRLIEQIAALIQQMARAEKLTSRERSSVTRAATDMYRTLQHLRNFCILNYTGLLKVLGSM